MWNIVIFFLFGLDSYLYGQSTNNNTYASIAYHYLGIWLSVSPFTEPTVLRWHKCTVCCFHTYETKLVYSNFTTIVSRQSSQYVFVTKNRADPSEWTRTYNIHVVHSSANVHRKEKYTHKAHEKKKKNVSKSWPSSLVQSFSLFLFPSHTLSVHLSWKIKFQRRKIVITIIRLKWIICASPGVKEMEHRQDEKENEKNVKKTK